MVVLPKNVLYYGREEALPERQSLRAGPLSLVYEAGDLRYIKLGNHEILRRIYVAVRDRNWLTVPMVLSNVQMDVAHNSFFISYDAEHKQGDVDFFWRGTMSGDAQGAITFRMAGEALSTFLRNRIGLCVLHPSWECAGVSCRIEHLDGTVGESVFPEHIAPQLIIKGRVLPHEPFAGMRAMSYPVLPGLQAELRFAGDAFEMEDQRNWTDASYKTYGTPLALPFPVKVKAGTALSQTVTLTLKGNAPEPRTKREDELLSFTLDQASTTPLPRIGLGAASHGQPLSDRELLRLKALNLAHLRVDLHLSRPGYEATLRRVATEAAALGVPLEVALFLSNEAAEELKGFVKVLEQTQPTVCTWLIFHENEPSTSRPWARLARKFLRGYDPAAKLGGGTNAYFTDLNRNRPPVQALDLVAYSLNPQVHAFDNASLVETLEGQAATVESARRFIGDLPLAVSPVTLKPRFLPTATGPAREAAPGELPRAVDERQMSLFGAGWTLGSLKHLAQSGAHSATYYETSGWRGVMETEAGSPLPEGFRSLPGSVFPLYHVLADVGDFAGGELIATCSSRPLDVDGLALRKDERMRLLVANFTVKPQTVTVRNFGGRVRVRHLNETNAVDAMSSPEAFRAQEGALLDAPAGSLELNLPLYAIARIDTVKES